MIRVITLHTTLKLEELLYEKRFLLDKKRTLANPRKRIVDAYTYEYVIEDDIKLIEMPTDYFLTNFHELEMMFTYFAKCKFLVQDVTPDNTILNKENAVIIDPDLFIKVNNGVSLERILYINKKKLLELFRDIILMELNVNKDFLNELFNNELAYEKEMSSVIAKRFIHTKKPIDLIRK